jgi:hypothetical protein
MIHVTGMAGVFDMANSFLVTVVEGDLTRVATNHSKLHKMFGKTRMSTADWDDVTEDLRPDISYKLRAKCRISTTESDSGT